jgi:hypothetical protein
MHPVATMQRSLFAGIPARSWLVSRVVDCMDRQLEQLVRVAPAQSC